MDWRENKKAKPKKKNVLVATRQRLEEDIKDQTEVKGSWSENGNLGIDLGEQNDDDEWEKIKKKKKRRLQYATDYQ